MCELNDFFSNNSRSTAGKKPKPEPHEKCMNLQVAHHDHT